MMKKILPTLIGAALVGGMTTASADVVVFGHIDTSIDFADQDGGSDTSNLNCTTCSFGLKGSEDLGNGLKAIFKLDFQYNTTERNRVQGGRDATSQQLLLTRQPVVHSSPTPVLLLGRLRMSPRALVH